MRQKYGQFCVIYVFNLSFASGSAIYCYGALLQVMMNSMNVPSKRSTLERKLDKLILALFATLFMMCFIGAIGRYELNNGFSGPLLVCC
jgi:putative copper export protein